MVKVEYTDVIFTPEPFSSDVGVYMTAMRHLQRVRGGMCLVLGTPSSIIAH